MYELVNDLRHLRPLSKVENIHFVYMGTNQYKWERTDKELCSGA